MKLSNNIKSLAIVALIIVGATFFFTRTSQKESINTPLVTKTETGILNLDSDQDGLKDWEEELWKTDSTKKDTDGDGVGDAEEVKQGRNPAIPGPDDAFDAETIEKKIHTVTESDLSETDKVSRMFFAAYIGAKKNGTSASVDVLQNFLAETVAQESQKAVGRIFTPQDLTIIEDSLETLRAYGNALAKILTATPPQALEHELLILNTAVEEDSEAELLKLIPLINEYKRIQDESLALAVPKSATALHIDLLNGTEGVIQGMEGMRLIFTDPIKSLPSITNYPNASELFVATLGKFVSFFKASGVSFKQGEDGYKIFRGI